MARAAAASRRKAVSAVGGRLDPARLPRFLNLFAIRFPVGALVSIGHRISGVCLLLFVPWAPDLLSRSLRGQAEYDALAAALRSPWAEPLVFVFLWAFCFHLLAGIRHLLMDAGLGARLRTARASARIVLALALLAALALLIAWRAA